MQCPVSHESLGVFINHIRGFSEITWVMWGFLLCAKIAAHYKARVVLHSEWQSLSVVDIRTARSRQRTQQLRQKEEKEATSQVCRNLFIISSFLVLRCVQEHSFYRATHTHSAVYGMARCPSVRLSHAGIGSKRLHISRRNELRLETPVFWKSSGATPTSAPVHTASEKNQRFFDR